ncbi:hypothetical protein [Candidatus Uabimicrobium sp. HlEnr_7]|uniref:hypothetical protein n=1 Tax=Candidatus Uabimicrobium helgolandensis TaxID=3095367 RepID=UPI0035575A85
MVNLKVQDKRWVVVSLPGSSAKVLLARAVGDEQSSHIGNQTRELVLLARAVGDEQSSHIGN